MINFCIFCHFFLKYVAHPSLFEILLNMGFLWLIARPGYRASCACYFMLIIKMEDAESLNTSVSI